MNPNMGLSLTDIQYKGWRTIATGIATTLHAADMALAAAPVGNTKEELFYITDSEGLNYFFDAVLRTEHNLQRQITQHPIQTGANISDHSFQLPSRLIMEIGMSDVMGTYASLSTSYVWSSLDKSVNAYQILVALMETGQTFDVFTRLNVYHNMIISNITTQEDYKTRYGLIAVITFQEIIMVDVAQLKVSAIEAVSNVNPIAEARVEEVTTTESQGRVQPPSQVTTPAKQVTQTISTSKMLGAARNIGDIGWNAWAAF